MSPAQRNAIHLSAAAVVALVIGATLAACGSATGHRPAAPRQGNAVALMADPAWSLQVPPSARVGPGPATATVLVRGYRVEVTLAPNRDSSPDAVGVRLTRAGRPVTNATIGLAVSMLDMDMGRQYMGRLRRVQSGRFRERFGALGMPGRWEIRLVVSMNGGRPFPLVLVDHMRS